MKISPSQLRALKALDERPIDLSTWGGQLMSSLPPGITTRLTLHSLYKKGLAILSYEGTREKWRITPAGRKALAEAERDDALALAQKDTQP